MIVYVLYSPRRRWGPWGTGPDLLHFRMQRAEWAPSKCVKGEECGPTLAGLLRAYLHLLSMERLQPVQGHCADIEKVMRKRTWWGTTPGSFSGKTARARRTGAQGIFWRGKWHVAGLARGALPTRTAIIGWGGRWEEDFQVPALTKSLYTGRIG